MAIHFLVIILFLQIFAPTFYAQEQRANATERILDGALAAQPTMAIQNSLPESPAHPTGSLLDATPVGSRLQQNASTTRNVAINCPNAHRNRLLQKPPKKTAFMSATELAIQGNLSIGDIIESKILVKLENGSILELPLVHKAIVVDPDRLQIIHYRYKDENDTTAEERRQLEQAVAGNSPQGNGPNDIVATMINSIVGQVKHDLRNADGLDDIRRIRINCRGPIRNGLMDMAFKYDRGNRKVYQDNLVQSIVEPCRINNELDACWRPLSPELIVNRTKKRIGEEQFRLKDHNCETFTNWARYGQNYTEQGQRIGAAIEKSINGFESLCEQANDDLVDLLARKVSDVKERSVTGAVFGGAAGGAVCLFFPPSCIVAIPLAAAAGGTISMKSAISDALRTGESEMARKLEIYKPRLVNIVKRMVAELQLEEIIKIAA